ncbi:ester cyclase [Streptomyces lunaelactis]|nr:ester cyclase [Streptomyces lunaelactis]NUK36006.1 ester cyclase [Streptomyces lunaelactis]NUK43422.1 ester cyclase [Streptomyces lunaelactis]NUK93068.1 ester cyclase [Streptomyces lunaelactis]NUL11455.1 ester cyclase [Streptomyces lunaelactis]
MCPSGKRLSPPSSTGSPRARRWTTRPAAAPVGTKVTFTGTDILRTERGKVVEDWLHSDTIALFGQLGVGGK